MKTVKKMKITEIEKSVIRLKKVEKEKIYGSSLNSYFAKVQGEKQGSF